MPQFLFDGRNGQRQAITPDNKIFNGIYWDCINLSFIKSMVRNFNGLTLSSEKVRSQYKITCVTETGETLSFPFLISKNIREIMKGLEEILSKQDWNGLTKENVAENHFKTYREAFRFLDANT